MDANFALRVNLITEKPNYSYKLRIDGVNRLDVNTDSFGNADQIFIMGTSNGSHNVDVKDIPANVVLTDSLIGLTVTGGSTGGGGGISKTMIMVGLAIGAIVLIGGKKIKW